MNRKVMLPVGSVMVKALMKEKGYTYRDIEAISEGRITEISLKHFLNKGTKVDESKLEILADLLSCSKDNLVDKNYLLSTNLPYEVNLIVGNLYLRNHENINRYYSAEIKRFKNMVNLKTMLDEAHRLFFTFSSEDYILDKTAFVTAFNIIAKDFATNKCISDKCLTKIQSDEANNLYSKINAASGDYNTQQVILMFLYVLILFDAIFLEEAVASATQLVPNRKTEKADQYFELAYRSERMRDTLIDMILYKGFEFNSLQITEFGIDDEVIEAIALMLAACEKCYRHIHSDHVDSEYVNRVEFSAILTRIEKAFENIGIELPQYRWIDECLKWNTTRFGIHYNNLKGAFNALNPPKKRSSKELENFQKGLFIGKMLSS